MTQAPLPGEPQAIDAVVEALRQQLQRDYPPGTLMRRDAHPKAHGCVQAELFVHRAIPSDCRHGVFANPGTKYLAWIRLSNALGVKPDLKSDTRGMAVKLLDVDGARLPDAEVGTQDFLAATHDAFFVPDAVTYVDFPEASASGPLATLRYFLDRRLSRGLRNAGRSIKTLAMNPLAVTYFSQTPYRLGPLQVKFKLQPLMTDALGESLPWTPLFRLRTELASMIMLVGDIIGMPSAAEWLARPLGHPDLLRAALARSLTRSDAWFEMLVQRREGQMSIEDATDSWNEGESPFQSVAWIRIPRQVFSPAHVPNPIWHDAAVEMERVCEHLSFSPWNGLVAHEPIGSINRARRRTNASSSTLRHTHNSEPRRPPTVAEFEALATRTRLTPGSVDPRPLPGPTTRRSRWWKSYFRRVPLLTALTMVAFPIASVWSGSPLAPFTSGVFDVSGPALLGVSILASLLAYTVLVAWWVITAYGDRRFSMPRAFYVYPIRSTWYLLSLLLVLPTALATWHSSTPNSAIEQQDWAFHWMSGIAVSLAIVWSVRWTADFIGGLPPVRALARLFVNAPSLGAGYVDRVRGQFLPGQLLSLGLVTVTAGIALMLGALTLAEPQPRFGALQFALVLAILVSSFLSAATFLLDRFNVPTLAPLLATALLLHDACGATHYFQLATATAHPAVKPHEVLTAPRSAAGAAPDRLVVVTASGGGTQSALWTAKALTGLSAECRLHGCAFDASVALISATSGGGVGAMHVVNGYHDGRLDMHPEHVVEAAGRSTQSAIWRALLYKDLVRPLTAFWPGMRLDDRAQALERAWAADLGGAPTVDGWQKDARRGHRPGMIFNSTIEETGDLMLISTAGRVEVPAPIPQHGSTDGRQVMRDFLTTYRGSDLAVVTAARLSAAFPIVTPFARDSQHLHPKWRLMDGGFADVYALDAAVEWLRQALAADYAGEGKVREVLVLQLRTPQLTDLPLGGPTRVRDQLRRDQRGLDTLILEYRDRVRIVPVVIELHDTPTVSWHLTERQRQRIDDAWSSALRGPAVQQVLQFFGVPRHRRERPPG